MIPNQVTIEAPPVSGPTPSADLIAGKFKDQADLIKAYKALEAKLGSTNVGPNPTPTPAPTPKVTPETPAATPAVPAQIDLAKYEAEYIEKGSLSQESFTELAAKGITQQQVSDFIAGRTARANGLIDSVGGQDKFKTMLTWAQANMKPEEIEAYNKAVRSNDESIARMAVENLATRFTKTYGTDPKLLGGQPSTTVLRYESQAQMLADMKDPRYSMDEAFRQNVYKRIEATNNG